MAPRDARLHFWPDADDAILRRRAGRGFTYHAPNGDRITDRRTLDRIRSLAIPPAWAAVRICPSPDGHLQAVGRDARGRKQYRYHPAFRRRRDAAKFESLVVFAQRLPAIRRQVEQDLARPGLSRERVLALVVRLLDITRLRVGNDEYRRDNGSYGLTTLRDRHARVEGANLRLRFRGKSGAVHEARVGDRRIASLVRRCQELPGQELFQYLDPDGERRDVRSDDVNAYLHALGGPEVSAKTFRTWSATVLACAELADRVGPADRAAPRALRRDIAAAMRVVAAALGNTPAVARRSDVHPDILDPGQADRLRTRVRRARAAARRRPTPGLSTDERATLAVLRGMGRARRRHSPA